MRLFYAVTLLFLIFLNSCNSATQIYIVRHAEKSTAPADDPHLTEEGKQRAETLKNLLKDKSINIIFSTEKNRNKETAAPLSNATGIPVRYYGNDTLHAFLLRVLNLKKNALIVAHSNTILPMLDALHLQHKKSFIADDDYENIFIVTVKNGKADGLTETTYKRLVQK